MLLWAGWILIVLGVAALPLDRRIAHFLYDHVSQAAHKRLNSITHTAKAGHWLGAAILALIIAAVTPCIEIMTTARAPVSATSCAAAFAIASPSECAPCPGSTWMRPPTGRVRNW